MEYFVERNSIVRQIWGKGDTILFIFVGASAEFALNKAVDWLYFTGRLPADPLGRLFSTVSYARKIVFSPMQEAYAAIDKINMIHAALEKERGFSIPQWAYRDVLFMLIHYSIVSFELLERQLSLAEKEDVYQVFYRLGERMHIEDLPKAYGEWLIVRHSHLENDLAYTNYTKDLYKQYRVHLGAGRFKLLKEGQVLVVPPRVRELLKLKTYSLLSPVVPVYKLSRKIKLDVLIKALILPSEYKKEISDLDVVPGT